MGYWNLVLPKRSPRCKKYRQGSLARLITPARKRSEPDGDPVAASLILSRSEDECASAVGARVPENVAATVIVEAAAEHEEVVGEAVQILERIWVDLLAARELADQALGPRRDRAREMQMGSGRGAAAPWGAFRWVQGPRGDSLQPEAIGAVMEVTKWL